MKFTLLPLILAVQFLAIHAASKAALTRGALSPSGHQWIRGLLVMLALWAVASGWLAWAGAYLNPAFLASRPAFWITLAPVAIVLVPAALRKSVRRALRALIDATAPHRLILFHGLRILAVGGIIKALNGEFALYFALWIGIPDMLFGFSALVMAARARAGKTTERAILLWNLAGALIIVPTAMILIETGLDGGWRSFSAGPGIESIFAFPMALAPTAAVPVFVMANLLTAVRIIERATGFEP